MFYPLIHWFNITNVKLGYKFMFTIYDHKLNNNDNNNKLYRFGKVLHQH